MAVLKSVKWTGLALGLVFLLYFLTPDGGDMAVLWWPLWIAGAIATVLFLRALLLSKGVKRPLVVSIVIYAVVAAVSTWALVPTYEALSGAESDECRTGNDGAPLAVYQGRDGAVCYALANLLSLPHNVVTFYGGPFLWLVFLGGA